MHPSRTRREAELRELAKLMRERAGMPPAPVPPALHKMAAARGERERDNGKTATTGEQP